MDNAMQKLEGLDKIGYQEMTVAELTSALAGLPPMMEVYIDAGGTSMYLNTADIERWENGPPFLRIHCDVNPVVPQDFGLSYEERLDKQKQVAMQLGRNVQLAEVMPEIVE